MKNLQNQEVCTGTNDHGLGIVKALSEKDANSKHHQGNGPPTPSGDGAGDVPGSPPSPAASGNEEDGAQDQGKNASRKTAKGKADLLAELLSSPEFSGDLKRIADLLAQEKSSGLEVGRIAQKWIGDKRYSHVLNADVFAKEYGKATGWKRCGRQFRNYINAYKVSELLVQASVDGADLDVSHLQQIADSHCESDEDRVELAKRVIEAKTPVRKIKGLALDLHAERRQAARTVDVVPTETKVRVIEALDLLGEQADGSIECAILDWQWSPATWGRNADYPEVHTPDDPVAHVCQCLEILKAKLAKVGSVFLFYRPVGFLNPRIQQTCERIGLKHAGKIIWQKTCGGFQDASTMLRLGHEEIHILCHKDYTPVAVSGGANSVTPKWGAPTHATSGERAVHRHQKPVALLDYLIRIATVNGLVVDPFAGSGTAGIAAERLGCSYVGSELKPKIAEIANRRIGFAKGGNDEIVEAVNFYRDSSTRSQWQIITSALAKCGLACVQTALRRAAA